MTQLKDPGKDKGSKDDRKAERLKAWKRPRTEKKRKQQRDERIADWEVRR